MLTEKLAISIDTIKSRFAGLDASKVDEALRPVEALRPPPEPADVPLSDLLGRAELVDSRAAIAVRLLEEIQAAGNLARLSIAELVSDPITNEEELKVALVRIRQAVIDELGDGKQVWLK